MNPSLRELQVILVDRVRLLSNQLDHVTSPEEAKKIMDEMQEFNHRATIVGGLLFREQSHELERKVEAIKQATINVDNAIHDIAEMANMLQVVSNFLALVDEVIDIAKLL